MTAPLEDLWVSVAARGDTTYDVTREHIRHMQARVEQFEALHQLKGKIDDIPDCKESFCKVVVQDSEAYAYRSVPASLPAAGAEAGGAEAGGGNGGGPSTTATVGGFEDLMARAQIPPPAAAALLRDVVSLGAAHVREMRQEDWEAVPTFGSLRVLERRRLVRTPVA